MTKKGATSVFRAGNLGELINALPALFGFQPEDSLAVLGLEGRRIVFGMRLDLADVRPDDLEATADLAISHLEHQGVEGAIVLAIGEPLDLGRQLVLAVEAGLVRVRPVAGGWATNDRYWVSMAGGDPHGYRYRRSLAHPAAAQAVWEGQEIVRSRSDLAAAMAPLEGERRAAIEAAADRVAGHFGGPLVNPDDTTLRSLFSTQVASTVDDLRRAKAVPDEQVLRLAFLTTSVPLRDAAWELITPENAHEFTRVWLHVARHAPYAWAPPAFCLAGFAAWLSGDGARALIASEQALRLDPEYSLAHLIVRLAVSGVRPQRWSSRQAAS